MNFIDNRKWLNTHFRPVAEMVREWADREPTGDVIVEPAKTGVLTLKVNDQGKMKYVHSKYDPLKEVDRILKHYDTSQGLPVLFLGVGLGYHIEKFILRNPNTNIIIFEPNFEVFIEFIKRVNLGKLMDGRLLNIYLDYQSLDRDFNELIKSLNQPIDIIHLPFYQKKLGVEYEQLIRKSVETLEKLKNSIEVDLAFKSRWIVNSIKNFPTILSTPNIVVSKQAYWEDKTVFIVSAGPSLNNEYENLRKIIKENKGIVLSVGSAINSLVKQNIHPHATLTYDPKDRNARVIEVIKEKNIKDIPLFFGSSVGYETLVDYPGDLYHFITSQDTLSQYLIPENEDKLINDAPSIAVLAVQIAIKLGFKKIVLVGQDLSYPTEFRHADGVEYKTFYTAKISDEEKDSFIDVENVKGGLNKTNESMLSMKQQLEMYFQAFPNVEVFNTSHLGVKIEGTTFIRLDEIIKSDELVHTDSTVLYPNEKYSLGKIVIRLKQLRSSRDEFLKNLKNAFIKMNEIEQKFNNKLYKNLENEFGKFDHLFRQVENNDYYSILIQPILRIEHQQLIIKTRNVREERNIKLKAPIIIETFMNYIKLIEFTRISIEQDMDSIFELIEEREQ